MWIDPVRYVKDWAVMPVSVPDAKETDYAVVALQALGSLLYDNPSLDALFKRDRFYLIRRQMRLITQMINELGFIGFTMELNSLGSEFLRCFRIGNSTISFDSTTLSSSPLYTVIRRLDCKDAGPNYLENNHLLIRWIYTFHVFNGKIPLSRDDLFDSAMLAWITRQYEVKWRPFNFSADIINLRSLVSWIIDVDDSQIPGRHGPGTTANREKTVAGKNRVFQHSIQSLQLTDSAPVDEIRELLSSPPASLWMLVSKDCKSLRPITAEDAGMQYGQQSLKMKWYLTTDFSTELPIRKYVKYADQSRSRSRALRGSQLRRDDSNPVTVDLSSASDYLSVELVANLFSGNLLHQVMSGRSWGSLIEGTEIELGMYAGMGSALTFPVQTTIFACMAVYSTLIALWEKENDYTPFNFEQAKIDYLRGDGFHPHYKKYEDSIQVYGDDIIVPELAASYLLDILKKCGLRVNIDKSFIGNAGVRESCGIFALGGRDITPLRFRIPPTKNGGLLDYAAYEGQRSLINRSFTYGYGNLYRFLISNLKSTGLLLTNKEYKKVGKAIGKEPNEVVFADYMLFEAYRGEADYLGIISTRDSEPTHRVRSKPEIHTVAVDTKAAYCVTSRSDIDLDLSSEYYHLTRNYLDWRLEELKSLYDSKERSEGSERSHGKIPRGQRLTFRSAIPLLKREKGEVAMAWGLAPR